LPKEKTKEGGEKPLLFWKLSIIFYFSNKILKIWSYLHRQVTVTAHWIDQWL